MSNDLTGISSEVPEWSREKITQFWMPNRKLLKSIRDYDRHKQSGSAWSSLFKRLAVLRHRFWSVITSADIPLNGKLGGGLSIPHPNGIVIHPLSVIGDPGAPIIGGHVDIGAGAKIIGNITIGEHALIGANAVVVKDVPAYAIVAGVPAKVVGYNSSNKSE